MNILIKNCLVVPMTATTDEEPKYYKGHVGISDRRIELAGTSGEEAEAFASRHRGRLKIIEAKGRILMPGLINLHNHAAMSLMRGYADDMPLMPWLHEKIWPFEARITPDDIALGTRLSIAEMLLGGTTAFVDMYWHPERIADAVLETGIRAVVCPTFLDRSYDTFVRQAPAFIEAYSGRGEGRIQVRISPHAPYTCSPEHLRGAAALCRRYGIGLHIHLSETLSETDLIRKEYGKTPTEHLESLGLLEVPSLAAHCVHMTDNDLEILRRSGVSVAHNPQSNMKLSSGVAPITRMLERGINVGIGTDGPSSNNDLDMWEELRTASLLQKVTTGDPCALPAYRTLQMATVFGAKAIGMEHELGVIRPGALADLILIDSRKPHLTPVHDPIANLAYCAKASDVECVIVNGQPLVEDGRLCGTDLAGLCREAGKRTEEIARR